jgi:hypothetical protein
MLLPYLFVRWVYGITLIIDGLCVLLSAGYVNPDLSLSVWGLANFEPYSDHTDEAKQVAQELKQNERNADDSET